MYIGPGVDFGTYHNIPITRVDFVRMILLKPTGKPLYFTAIKSSIAHTMASICQEVALIVDNPDAAKYIAGKAIIKDSHPLLL